MTMSALIGALLFFGGIVYMAWVAIQRGKMSDPESNRGRTLEPRHRGLGFIGLKANWPGLAMLALGALLLLSSAL